MCDTYEACDFCSDPVVNLGGPDESLAFCPGCDMIVEGHTHEVAEDEQ